MIDWPRSQRILDSKVCAVVLCSLLGSFPILQTLWARLSQVPDSCSLIGRRKCEPLFRWEGSDNREQSRGEGRTDTLEDMAPPPLTGHWTQALHSPHLFLMMMLWGQYFIPILQLRRGRLWGFMWLAMICPTYINGRNKISAHVFPDSPYQVNGQSQINLGQKWEHSRVMLFISKATQMLVPSSILLRFSSTLSTWTLRLQFPGLKEFHSY